MESQNLLIEQLHLLEERLLQPQVRKSVNELESLLADDFIEFGSSGCIYNKRQMIDGLIASPIEEMEILDSQVKLLASGIALITYRAVKHIKPSNEDKYSLRSSIWRFNGNKWQMIFHQGTQSVAP